MWSLAVIILLCCLMGWLILSSRRKALADADALAQAAARQESLTRELADQTAQCGQCHDQIRQLTEQLAQKNAEIDRLTALSVQKLCLPLEQEEIPARAESVLVYLNPRTGVYHGDRFCAPRSAVETDREQIPESARPCKKCGSNIESKPLLILPDEAEDTAGQLSLF